MLRSLSLITCAGCFIACHASRGDFASIPVGQQAPTEPELSEKTPGQPNVDTSAMQVSGVEASVSCPTDGVALWALREFVEEHKAELEQDSRVAHHGFRTAVPTRIRACTSDNSVRELLYSLDINESASCK